MLLSRHCIPKYSWKLEKWLQIGQANENKVAQENVYRFLKNCISSYKDDEAEDESPSSVLKELMKEGLGKGEMTKEYIRDTALNLLAAGNGTVSSGISWFFWLVSTHPIVEAKIIQEIKDKCLTQEKNSITDLSVQELDKLVYLHGAICEALRLYPPLAFQHKCAINDDILPSGHYVSPNTKLIYSLYAMGRMEQIWGQDCFEFKPERWISDRGDIIHVPSNKFIAFNTGPRSCLGKDISLFQMKMVATAILWKFQIQVVKDHLVMPRISIILRMKHGLKVEVTKRDT
jgi:cytochrome P450